MPGIATTIANSLVSAEVRATAYTGPTPLYMSLHSADPGSNGANEASGGSYARQLVTFGAPSSGTALNTNTINFASLPAFTASHAGLWDAATAGNFLQSGAMTASVPVSVGNTLQFQAGQVSFNVSAI